MVYSKIIQKEIQSLPFALYSVLCVLHSFYFFVFFYKHEFLQYFVEILVLTITSLPGQLKVSFQQFASYITVDEEQQRALFYYFVEAEKHPVSKPLVLWLNGGPGYSSFGTGALIEHGPFKVSGDVLVRNEYSCNKEANMLYLESPAGVGFSYSTNKSFYNYVNNDMAAQDGLIFLKCWFAKFPEYQNREFFIARESCAGHYVPQLAQLIVQSKVRFNLKGIAIGNSLLEFSTDYNSRDEYYWSHGLISDAVYELLTEVCNFSQIIRESMGKSSSPACTKVTDQLAEELDNFAVNPYYVTGGNCLGAGVSQMEALHEPLRSRLHSQSNPLNQQQVKEKKDICPENLTTKYLNRKDVQHALHAQLIGETKRVLCSKNIQYDLEDRFRPTIRVVGSLVESGIRALVYSGDQDAVIPFIATWTLVDALAKALGLKTTVPYKPWFEGKLVGGWTQVYGNHELSFASIRGASHTAPESQPQRSFSLFKAFLAGKPLRKA